MLWLSASATVSDAATSAAPCPTTASRMPLSVCETASCRTWPATSGISESTSVAMFDIAIRTKLSDSVLITRASTTVPGCNTRSGTALSAATTGRIGVMEIGMARARWALKARPAS